MNNALYKDTATSHRCLIGNVRRVVYARHDWEGNFVRFVIHRTKAEIDKERKSYLPAQAGIKTWFEVSEINFHGK